MHKEFDEFNSFIETACRNICENVLTVCRVNAVRAVRLQSSMCRLYQASPLEVLRLSV